MSEPAEVTVDEVSFEGLPFDDRRGTMGMLLAITTEALLFVALFFAYFYIGHRHEHWPTEPPKIMLALVMLGVLLLSSVVLHLGEHSLKKGHRATARALLWLTVLLGIAFLAVQVLEYRKHLVELKPTSNAYGSLFYVITSFHGLHVVVGILMIVYSGILPSLEPRALPPHKPLHNASLYWHFVDTVWVFIVLLLYLLPRWTR
jgi:cytochrome c oxidase subunit III